MCDELGRNDCCSFWNLQKSVIGRILLKNNCSQVECDCVFSSAYIAYLTQFFCFEAPESIIVTFKIQQVEFLDGSIALKNFPSAGNSWPIDWIAGLYDTMRFSDVVI